MTTQKLETQTTLVNDRVQFSGKARNNPFVLMDYFPPFGDGEGYTGLEMLLLSLSGCSCTAIKVLLQKMNKTVEGLTVAASGIRKEAAPYAFSHIHLVYTLTSSNADDAVFEKANIKSLYRKPESFKRT